MAQATHGKRKQQNRANLGGMTTKIESAIRKGYPSELEPLPLTWELILGLCPSSEVDEIKRVIGTSLVQQVIDLQEEVS